MALPAAASTWSNTLSRHRSCVNAHNGWGPLASTEWPKSWAYRPTHDRVTARCPCLGPWQAHNAASLKEAPSRPADDATRLTELERPRPQPARKKPKLRCPRCSSRSLSRCLAWTKSWKTRVGWPQQSRDACTQRRLTGELVGVEGADGARSSPLVLEPHPIPISQPVRATRSDPLRNARKAPENSSSSTRSELCASRGWPRAAPRLGEFKIAPSRCVPGQVTRPATPEAALPRRPECWPTGRQPSRDGDKCHRLR